MRRSMAWGAACLGLVFSSGALANERRFTDSYESAVLSAGQKEIELWMTPRIGREDSYARFDNRVELELGLSPRVQTSLYLNFTTRSHGTSEDPLEGSLSSEWKLKLLDPVADALGLALYGEVTGNLEELELEAKVILDKRVGDVLLALNLSGEREWGFEGGVENVLGQTAGISYLVTPAFGVGLEARHHAVFDGAEFEGSALYVGPTVSYASRHWWLAATFAPQVAAILPAERGGRLELEEHERFNGRLLVGFHL